MIARDNAERRQTETTNLITQALNLLQQHIAALTSALDDAEPLTSEAQAIAKGFNRKEASAWVLAENCGISFAKTGIGHIRLFLHNMADIKMTPCTVEPGILMKLSGSVSYKDCERGATVAVTAKEWQWLEENLLASRVKDSSGRNLLPCKKTGEKQKCRNFFKKANRGIPLAVQKERRIKSSLR